MAGYSILREAFYELRLRGTAYGGLLKEVAVEVSSYYDPKLWNGDWGGHALSTQDYFERLPHVGRADDGRYQFEGDPTSPSTPGGGPVLDGVEIAAKAVAPHADERIEIRKRATQTVMDDHGRPGGPHWEAMSPTRPPSRASTTRRSAAERSPRGRPLPTTSRRGPFPEYVDAARDPGLWMREFGRPVLKSRHVVGVEVPETLAGPYPFGFVGIDADADIGLESVERADVEAAIDSLLDATDTGGRRAWRDRRRATLAALFERVRDDGPVDAETLIDEEIPAREIGYAVAATFWQEVARDPSSRFRA